MKKLLVCTVQVLALASSFAGAAVTAETIATVSPGELDRSSLESRCPTFSWTAVPGARHYELVVYEISAQLTASERPALVHVVPGGALSWTPARTNCLADGASYAWVVRAVKDTDPDPWSRERMFRTEAQLGDRDVAEALAVVRRYLEEGGSLERLGADQVAEVEEVTRAQAEMRYREAESPSVGRPAVVGEETSEPRAPSTQAPNQMAVPFSELGLNSQVGGDFVANAKTAVRGLFDRGELNRKTVGYLGLQVGDLMGGDLDGFAEAKGLSSNLVGVLGLSVNGNIKSHGVVGISETGAGGFFYATDDTGSLINEVRLGTQDFSVDAGSGSFSTLSWECPGGMDRAGTWCIDSFVQAAGTVGTAIHTCHNVGAALCPVEALLMCDFLNIRNSDVGSCGHATDTAGQVMRTSTVNAESTGGASSLERFVEYNATANALTVSSAATIRNYFCCKPVSP